MDALKEALNRVRERHEILRASFTLFIRELEAGYEDGPASEACSDEPLYLQYSDYARWQRTCLRGDALEKISTEWCRRLAHAGRRIDLPTVRRSRASGDPKRTWAREWITPSLRRKIADLADESGTEASAVYLPSATWSGGLRRRGPRCCDSGAFRLGRLSRTSPEESSLKERSRFLSYSSAWRARHRAPRAWTAFASPPSSWRWRRGPGIWSSSSWTMGRIPTSLSATTSAAWIGSRPAGF